MNSSEETTASTKNQPNSFKIISLAALGLASLSLVFTAGTAFAESNHRPEHRSPNFSHSESNHSPLKEGKEKGMEKVRERNNMHEGENKKDTMHHGGSGDKNESM